MRQYSSPSLLDRCQDQKDPFVAGLGTRTFEYREAEWYVDITIDGRNRRPSLGRVGEISRRTVAAIADQLVASNAGTSPFLPTVRDVAVRYLQHKALECKPATIKSHRYGIETFGLLGELPINRVQIERVREWYLAKPCARHLSVLSGVMAFAERIGLVPDGNNPCKGLQRKKTKFEATYLSEQNYREVGQVLKLHFARQPVHVAAILLLAMSGARKSEILNCCWYQVTDRGLDLPDSKSGPRFVVLCPEARWILTQLPKGDPSHFILKHANGRKLSQNSLAAFWKQVKREAHLPKRTRLHDLRHSMASVGLNEGEELAVVGDLLGHKDYSSTLCYAHLARKTVKCRAELTASRLMAQMEGGDISGEGGFGNRASHA